MQPDGARFAPDYNSARARFCALAKQAGAQHERHTHPTAKGPQGESLSVDIARLGAGQPQRLVIISSGVHGIEGFIGSAVQNHALEQQMFARLPADIAVVLVHAVNPFGFAHHRRCNEDGIDLNRNFIDWSKAKPAEHEHTGWLMERAFVPQPKQDEVDAFIKAQGDAVYLKAMAQGQYRFPLGVCYGGTAPAWSHQVWNNILTVHAAKVPELVHIDLHSGYGPVGGATILTADDMSTANIARAKAWWGEQLEYSAPANSSAAALANVSGPIECSFALYKPEANTLSVTIEKGTIPFPQVLATLVSDHQRVAAQQPATAASIASMRAAYAPVDVAWQTSVVSSFTRIIQQGLAGMAAEKSLRLARARQGPQ